MDSSFSIETVDDKRSLMLHLNQDKSQNSKTKIKRKSFKPQMTKTANKFIDRAPTTRKRMKYSDSDSEEEFFIPRQVLKKNKFEMESTNGCGNAFNRKEQVNAEKRGLLDMKSELSELSTIVAKLEEEFGLYRESPNAPGTFRTLYTSTNVPSFPSSSNGITFSFEDLQVSVPIEEVVGVDHLEKMLKDRNMFEKIVRMRLFSIKSCFNANNIF